MTKEEELGLDSTQKWGYYNSLKPGPEHDGLGEDWFRAGEIGDVSFKDAGSVQRLHQLLDSFNKTLLENPDDMRYRFVAESSRLRKTSDNRDSNDDLIILIQPIDSDVTLDDLRNFTSQVKGQ